MDSRQNGRITGQHVCHRAVVPVSEAASVNVSPANGVTGSRSGWWIPVLAALLALAQSVAASGEAGSHSSTAAGTGQNIQEAIFAGGCFWCSESDFEKIKGVREVQSGYTHGQRESPTYQEVSAGTTGHIEAVRVQYDATRVSYEQLLTAYWFSIDPLAENAQFCDSGAQYRSAIFYRDQQQKQAIMQSRALLTEQYPQLKGKIRTELLPESRFWPAEDFHQDYYRKNPIRYRYYRYRCGRDARLKQLWGDRAGWQPGGDALTAPLQSEPVKTGTGGETKNRQQAQHTD